MSGLVARVGGTAVLPDRQLPNALVLSEADRLALVGQLEEARTPGGARRIDASALLVLPGLIDTHVHGAHGDDVMLDGEEGIRRISRRFARYGTTAWLPSTVSARRGELLAA